MFKILKKKDNIQIFDPNILPIVEKQIFNTKFNDWDNIPSILKPSFEEIKLIIADLPETISPFSPSFLAKQILEECGNSENFMLSVKSLLELRPVIFVELACCMPSLTIPENDNIRYENALRNQKEELIIRLTDKYNINDIRDETFIIGNDRGTNYEDTLFSNDNSISELFASNIGDHFPILVKILKKSSVLRAIVNLLVEENTLYPIKLICKDHITPIELALAYEINVSINSLDKNVMNLKINTKLLFSDIAKYCKISWHDKKKNRKLIIINKNKISLIKPDKIIKRLLYIYSRYGGNGSLHRLMIENYYLYAGIILELYKLNKKELCKKGFNKYYISDLSKIFNKNRFEPEFYESQLLYNDLLNSKFSGISGLRILFIEKWREDKITMLISILSIFFGSLSLIQTIYAILSYHLPQNN